MQSLVNQFYETQQVVADSDDRKPFHGFLNLDLGGRPRVQALQDGTVLLLHLDLHPRLEQFAKVRNAVTQALEALMGGRAVSKGGFESALNENAQALAARHMGFA
ncbi:hypothetical protein D9M68_813510 [compost metagenome]